MSDIDFWTLFDDLGERIGLTKANVIQIKQRKGVPHKHHTPLVRMANGIGVPLTHEQIPTVNE